MQNMSVEHQLETGIGLSVGDVRFRLLGGEVPKTAFQVLKTICC